MTQDYIKDFRRDFPKSYGEPKGYQGSTMLYVPYEEVIHRIEHIVESVREEERKECPPHNFVPHSYTEAWSGTTPPPNMKCTKCLSTQYF